MVSNMLSIPIGISDFRKIRENKYFYIDKTYFLEEFFRTQPAEVSLITRPRRFGKTLTMSMLAEFFDITKQSTELFNNLAITKNKELCSTWMNQYPVLSLSLKGIDGMTFQESLDAISELIGKLCDEHSYLLESQNISSFVKKSLQNFYNLSASLINIRNSLKIFTDALYQYFNKPVILLLDEYDVPINAAWNNDFYTQMISFMRGFLGEALKDNQYLKFAIITGCLRISKESIFTGVNNFRCYTISNNIFSSTFGFTQDEVDTILNAIEFSEQKDDTHYKIRKLIKEWYDGYRFGKNIEIYCPWDILQYVGDLQEDHKKIPEPYWINTSANAIIKRLIERDEVNINEAIEALVNGRSVRVSLQEAISFDDLQNDPSLVWSILYATGYLTKTDEQELDGNQAYNFADAWDFKDHKIDLVIPNKEVYQIFISTIHTLFKSYVKNNLGFRTRFLEAIWNGDSKKVTSELQKILLLTISYYDTQEYFYHAFMTGLFVGIQGLKVESNRENGYGRTDITISDLNTNKIAIFEIKHLKIETKKAKTSNKITLLESIKNNDTQNSSKILEDTLFFTQETDPREIKKLLKYLSEKAILQIKINQYAIPYLLNSVNQSITIFGISFYKKECVAIAEVLDTDESEYGSENF